MKVLVLGYGNEFREDDRVGHELAPLIVEWLLERGEDAELWLGAQLLPELACDLSEVDLAVFVDASTIEYPQGYSIEEVKPDPQLDGLNIHSMGPAWLLSMMDDLDYRRPRTLLLSVSGVSFNFSDSISETCRESIEKAFKAFKESWDNL